MPPPAPKSELVAMFDKYNKALWGGALPRPALRWRYSRATYGCWTPPCEKHPRGEIWISSGPRGDSPAEGWHATLLHEMVHHALWHSGEDEHDGHEHHGSAFTTEANRLGQVLGVAPCDEDEAPFWPQVLDEVID